MSIYKRGGVYWYSFIFDGRRVQRSTKQGNRKAAIDIESAYRTALAKGAVGLLQRKAEPIPLLADFLKDRFMTWCESTFAAKPATYRYYRHGARRLKEYAPLASSALDEINGEKVAGFVAKRQADGIQITAINREIQVLRRAMRLAVEWGVIKSSPKVRMLPGENKRERVILPEEEARYLGAAEDPLASIAIVLVDSGFRPEECFRLKWESITWLNGRHGTMLCTHGKTKAARRTIPMTPRVRTVLESRWRKTGEPDCGWVWRAPTRSGHIEPSSLRKQHARAFRVITEQAAQNNQKQVRPFVLYDLRHTFLTRLGQSGCEAECGTAVATMTAQQTSMLQFSLQSHSATECADASC